MFSSGCTRASLQNSQSTQRVSLVVSAQIHQTRGCGDKCSCPLALAWGLLCSSFQQRWESEAVVLQVWSLTHCSSITWSSGKCIVSGPAPKFLHQKLEVRPGYLS